MTGKISIQSLGGYYRFVVFLETFIAMIEVYLIKNKSQFMDCLPSYKALAKNESQLCMYEIRLDNEDEQSRHEFQKIISDNGWNMNSHRIQFSPTVLKTD